MMESIDVVVDEARESRPDVEEDVGASYLQNDDPGMEEETEPNNEDVEKLKLVILKQAKDYLLEFKRIIPNI